MPVIVVIMIVCVLVIVRACIRIDQASDNQRRGRRHD